MTVKGKGGRPRLFDPVTARRRKHERDWRDKLADRRQCQWLKQNHPKLYDQSRSLVEAEIIKERGPLPGEEPE